MRCPLCDRDHGRYHSGTDYGTRCDKCYELDLKETVEKLVETITELKQKIKELEEK